MPPFEVDSKTKAQGALFSVATTEAAEFGKPLSFYTEGVVSENDQATKSLAHSKKWILKEKKKNPASFTGASQLKLSKNTIQTTQYPLIMSKKSKTILDQKMKQITDKE